MDKSVPTLTHTEDKPSKWALERAQKWISHAHGEEECANDGVACLALEFDAIARERDEVTEKLAEALDFMYRYFVMPGHPERAQEYYDSQYLKDCPNKDCPFCKADEAIAAYRERNGMKLKGALAKEKP